MMKCKTKNFEVKLQTVDPTGVVTATEEIFMDIIDDNECMRQERLILHVGECLYRINQKGYIIERLIPHD
jgi:hypothetical protein